MSGPLKVETISCLFIFLLTTHSSSKPLPCWLFVLDVEKYLMGQILPAVQARDQERRGQLTQAWLLCLQKLFVAVITWALLRYSIVSVS